MDTVYRIRDAISGAPCHVEPFQVPVFCLVPNQERSLPVPHLVPGDLHSFKSASEPNARYTFTPIVRASGGHTAKLQRPEIGLRN